jgi:hypothetical protein
MATQTIQLPPSQHWTRRVCRNLKECIRDTFNHVIHVPKQLYTTLTQANQVCDRWTERLMKSAQIHPVVRLMVNGLLWTYLQFKCPFIVYYALFPSGRTYIQEWARNTVDGNVSQFTLQSVKLYSELSTFQHAILSPFGIDKSSIAEWKNEVLHSTGLQPVDEWPESLIKWAASKVDTDSVAYSGVNSISRAALQYGRNAALFQHVPKTLPVSEPMPFHLPEPEIPSPSEVFPEELAASIPEPTITTTWWKRMNDYLHESRWLEWANRFLQSGVYGHVAQRVHKQADRQKQKTKKL